MNMEDSPCTAGADWNARSDRDGWCGKQGNVDCGSGVLLFLSNKQDYFKLEPFVCVCIMFTARSTHHSRFYYSFYYSYNKYP